ncbi:hypothetical protein IV505_09625 [Pseudomonas fulva]|nr:hypothetical protein [Pseudomonas fulva]MBF8779985.1 hypothetical protein [Pseudomonas fulva]
MKTNNVNPLDLRDIAKSFGWELMQGVTKDIYIFVNPLAPNRQIIFPKHSDAADYVEASEIAIENLSKIHSTTPEALKAQILNIRDDVISYRITNHSADLNSLPISFASELISAAELALLSSACSVIRPATHHKRLTFGEATQLIRRSRLGHTQHGSFIINVSCPVDGAQPSLEMGGEHSSSLGREAVMTINQGSQALVAALETDSLDSFVDDLQASERPLVSSNFCDALIRMHDEDLNNDVELLFRWSPTMSIPTSRKISSKIRIQREYFPRIEEIKQALKHPDTGREDLYIGTVELLNGDMGPDGRRAGEVIIALLIDSSVVRSRAFLNADDYEKAVECHTKDGHHVAVYGKVMPGRQPRSLESVQYFDVIRPK